MEVTFTRLAGAAYSVSVLRSDGVTLSLRPAGASRALPHDLAHFVVESELGLEQGFWGCVAAGAVIPGLAVVSGRRRPHATERSHAVLRTAGQRPTEAEHMVKVVLEVAIGRMDERAPSRALALINDGWRPPGRSRARIGPADLARVCNRVRQVKASWLELAAGEALTLAWPLDGPGVASRPPRGRARRRAR